MKERNQLVIYAIVISLFWLAVIILVANTSRTPNIELTPPEPTQIVTSDYTDELKAINDNLFIIEQRLLRIELRATEDKQEIMEEYGKMVEQLNGLTNYLVRGE